MSRRFLARCQQAVWRIDELNATGETYAFRLFLADAFLAAIAGTIGLMPIWRF